MKKMEKKNEIYQYICSRKFDKRKTKENIFCAILKKWRLKSKLYSALIEVNKRSGEFNLLEEI